MGQKTKFSVYRVNYTHGFNTKIGFEKYAPSPKKLPKNCQKSAFQTKPAKLDTFWPISRYSLHTFQNRFLRCNRESEPVDLNTMNPIIRTNFFSRIKGSDIFLKLRAPKLNPLKNEKN